MTEEELAEALAHAVPHRPWVKDDAKPAAATKWAKENPAKFELMKGIIAGVVPALHDEIEPLKAQISALQARVLELEAQRDEMRYCGVWREGKEYTPGSFTTHDGALWHANRKTAERPGNSGDWVLAAKSGQPVAHPRPDAATPNARNGSFHGTSNPRFR
jgi:hypothetical protein